MEIKYNVLPSGVYFYLYGELDECTAKDARERIDDIIDRFTRAQSVVFNMKGITFMDSTGIGMVIGRYKKLKKLNIPVYIENPSFSADKVFIVSGIYKLIPKL